MSEFKRQKNNEYRSREYLNSEEIHRLLECSELRGRHPVRDLALLLITYRHALRSCEAVNLRWDAILMENKIINIKRVKGSKSGVHPLQPDEIDALKSLKSEYPHSQYLFVSERSPHISTYGLATLVKRCGELAELPFKVHPHMLRHSCGFHLGEQGSRHTAHPGMDGSPQHPEYRALHSI